MSFDAGSISGSLKFDVSDYTHAILQAQSISSIFPGIVTTFLESPLLGFIDTIKEAGAALVELATRFSEVQNHTRQLADSLGVSLQFLDGWGKAATLTGGNTEMVAEAITHLSHTANLAAREGGATAEAFHKLGVNIFGAGGHLKPTQELLEQVSDGLKRMGAGAERTGITMEILGRGGASTLAFLGQGSTAINEIVARLDKMGLVTSDATAKSAQAFEEMWATVKLAWNGILAKIAEPVRIALMPILEDLLTWMETHPQEIQEAIEEMAKVISEAFALVRSAIQFAVEHFNTIIALMGAAGIGAAALVAVQSLGLMEGAFASLAVQLDIATASQLAFNAAANGLKGAGIGGGIGATFGTGIEGTVGGSIGGGIGAIAGGILGGPLGAYAGSVIGGGIGTGIGSAFASPININVTAPGRSDHEIATEASQAAAQEVYEQTGKRLKRQRSLTQHHQNISATLRGDR